MTDPREPVDAGNDVDSDAPIVDALFPADEPEPEARRQVTVRGVAIVGGRVVTGIAGIAVAAVVIGAASFVPLPTVTTVPASVMVTPVPTAQQLVCAGAVLRLADDTGQGATIPSPVGSGPVVDYAASAGEVDAVPLEQSDAGTGGTRSAPLIISSPPGDDDDGERVLISGAQAESVSEGDFVGLAAGGCAPVSGDIWLPAGSTAVGRTTLLTLANPTEVAATVNVEIFDVLGKVSAPGSSGIIVPPNGQRVLSVAGFAPGLESPVVHVTSSGGQVVANLQEAIVRGLDAGGVDIVAPAAPLANELVVPGVVIANAIGAQQLLSRGADYADVMPVLRLFAPGEGTVEGTLSVIAEDGAATGTALAFDFEAGQAIDVPIMGFEHALEDGEYTVRVTTSLPAVGTVRATAVGAQSTGDAPAPSDVGWFAAAPALHERAQVTIADGPSPRLHLHNLAATAASIAVGEEVVELPPGASIALDVTAGETLELEGFDALAAAVSFVDGGRLASYPVVPPGTVSTPVLVYP